MLRKSTALLIFFSLFFTSAFSQSHNEAARKIDSLFSRYNTKTPGAAIAIVKDGKVILKKGYGMANLEHDIPITPQTVFNIASVSKQFTAFSIYLLESEGKVSFEDDIRKYIPEIPDHGKAIRIRHLLGHTSGLRDQAALMSLAGFRAADVISTEQIIKMLARQKALNYVPGTTFNYNNTGYTLLAELVRRVTGKTFSQYTEEKIFKPLGMNNTQFCDNHEKVIKNKAESYELVNGVYHHKPLNASNPGPSNLLTTVEDLAKWVLNFEDPKVGTRQLIQSFNEASYLDNGQKTLLRIIEGDSIFHAKGQNLSKHNGLNIITHGGHAAAFRTFLGRFPDQRLGIIMLSNDEHNEQLPVRWQLADFYIKDKYIVKENASTTGRGTGVGLGIPVYSDKLEDFEGEYYNEEVRNSYTVKIVKGKLIMAHARLNDVELKRVGENIFSGSGPETFAFEMEFLRNGSGVVTGFSISNFGVKKMRFEKLK